MTPSLLATDLDGTVIPPPHAPPDDGVERFGAAVAERDGLVLAYVTGRHHAHALEGVRKTGLPRPDVLVCDVGTAVYRPAADGSGWNADPEYRKLMAEALGGVGADELRKALADARGIRLQEEEKQSAYKVSYYTVGPPELDDVVRDVRERLADVADVSLVTSVDPLTGEGNLDLLPGGVAKDRAVRFVREALELSPGETVYAGDSGNDRAALLSGVKAILVGNARRELRDQLVREARSSGLDGLLYLADAPYARGVLEGCRHFGLLE